MPSQVPMAEPVEIVFASTGITSSTSKVSGFLCFLFLFIVVLISAFHVWL